MWRLPEPMGVGLFSVLPGGQTGRSSYFSRPCTSPKKRDRSTPSKADRFVRSFRGIAPGSVLPGPSPRAAAGSNGSTPEFEEESIAPSTDPMRSAWRMDEAWRTCR